MRSNPKPNPFHYSSGLGTRLKNDPQVKKWAKRLMGDPEAKPTDLTESELAFVYSEVLKLRGELGNQQLFEKAMHDTCPVLAAPDWTDNAKDMGHVLMQPEMQALWDAWDPAQSPTAPDIDFAPAKAVLMTLSMCGFTSYFDDALEHYGVNQKLQDVFAGANGGPVDALPYTTTMRHVHRAAKDVRLLAMETNIALVKELAKMFPGEGIGERLGIDGMPFSAWVPQRGSRDEQVDKAIGKRIPQAGFRVYTQSSRNGKQNIPANTQVAAGGAGRIVKAFRGFYLVVIVDLATGLPLVWTLLSASDDEAATIVPLLSILYRLWPDIPAKTISGDSAWDEDPWCRLCEVDYGIAPVFRLHPSQREQKAWDMLAKNQRMQSLSRDGAVLAITGTGQLVCSAHQQPLDYDTFDRPARVDVNGAPLLPGQSTDERKFRLRATCNHNHGGVGSCGRVGLKGMADWSRLTKYPHHPHGNPKLYAMRQALLVRLNHCESLWNRLKSAGLGTDSADRMRTIKPDTAEAVASLALLGYTALAVADQRQQRAIGPYAPAAGNPQPRPAQIPAVAAPAPTPAPAPALAPAPAPTPAPAIAPAAAPSPAPTAAPTPSATPPAQAAPAPKARKRKSPTPKPAHAKRKTTPTTVITARSSTRVVRLPDGRLVPASVLATRKARS